jgi:hypothetical protein
LTVVQVANAFWNGGTFRVHRRASEASRGKVGGKTEAMCSSETSVEFQSVSNRLVYSDYD